MTSVAPPPPPPATATATRRRAPRWYFGWNIVAAATVLSLLTMGMRMGIGPLFLPMAEDLGFSRSLLAGIVAVGMLFFGLAMPVAGFLVGRYGTRFVLLAGTAMVVVATLWSVSTRSALGQLLSFGVLMSIGFGFTSPVALTQVISRWFTRRRGVALYLLATGSVAGIAIMTPALTFALHVASWQTTMLGFAAVFTVLTVPAAIFVIRDDAPPGTDLPAATALAEATAPAEATAATAATASAPTPGPAESSSATGRAGYAAALRTVPILQVASGLFACGFSMNLLGTHGMPMLMDHGFDATTGAFGIGLIGLVAILGTLVLGRLSDRLPRRYLLATVYFVRGLGFLALLVVGEHWELYLAATIGGLVWAGGTALSAAVIADVYGVRLVGVLYGSAYLVHQVGGMAGSWLGGWGFETFGTHWPAFGAAAALLIAAAALVLRLPPRGALVWSDGGRLVAPAAR